MSISDFNPHERILRLKRNSPENTLSLVTDANYALAWYITNVRLICSTTVNSLNEMTAICQETILPYHSISPSDALMQFANRTSWLSNVLPLPYAPYSSPLAWWSEWRQWLGGWGGYTGWCMALSHVSTSLTFRHLMSTTVDVPHR